MSRPPSKDPVLVELEEVRRQLADLQRQMRQVPSRFPVTAADAEPVTVRVRFYFSHPDGDGSEAEDLESGEIYWLDGYHALAALRPQAFGNGVSYQAEIVGNVTRSSVTRRGIRLVAPATVAAPNGAQLELAAASATTGIWYAKVLDSASAVINTTIDGVASANHVPMVGDSWWFTTWRYDWCLGRYSAGLAAPDIGTGVTGLLSTLFRGGSSGARNATNPADLASSPTATAGTSIDPTETFRVDVMGISYESSSDDRGGDLLASFVLCYESPGQWRIRSLSRRYLLHLTTSLATLEYEPTMDTVFSGTTLPTLYLHDAGAAGSSFLGVTLSLTGGAGGRIAAVELTVATPSAFTLGNIALLVTGGRSI